MLQEQNVTAIYRRFTSADLVRQALRDHGIEIARVHVIPDRVTGIDDAADFGLYDSVIRDLDLPEADIRAYQDAVRRGDFVVSATVPSSEVPQVQEIMSHPEAFGDRVDRVEARAEPEPEDARLATERPVETTFPLAAETPLHGGKTWQNIVARR
ncbi:MAG: hypothetical protein DI556_04935 [Rhodovulum sulfidophilum]|uniref:Uncharacterized protein n=1 Tax=Rhodovulum sulfidophilum TaxID=35806 RepID=A0A2W5NEB7_RHOSU|nr:MAG: hypothetical protein DI556_04935 [Rhodovulum sulfidophilum]